MGWNNTRVVNNFYEMKFSEENKDYYFVHSYFFDCLDKKNIIGLTNYGLDFPSIVGKENIYGVQFHPEKSSDQGLELIKNLNGFYYTPNELAESFGIKSSNREVGLSAQEVNKILPELTDLAPFDMCLDNDGNIKSKSGNNYLTISYERMVPVIIESLKELTQEVEALKKENKILKEKIMRV